MKLASTLRYGYDQGMKVAISIPDDVFAEADRMAAQLKTTRSALYGQALKAFLQNIDGDLTCDALNDVIDAVGPPNVTFAQTAAQRRLLQAEW